MTRHTIVLAEEKGTIQKLVKKAVEGKPLGQEKIREVLAVNDELSLSELLATQREVGILLLSNTLSEMNHEKMIEQIKKLYPDMKIISLTNKYGDRSSLAYGAFESVDKPIRNPVLWERIDRAIEAIEEEEAVRETVSEPLVEGFGFDLEDEAIEENEITSPVVEESSIFAVETIEEKTEETVIPKVRPESKPVYRAEQAVQLFASDDDDGEDDLFESVPVKSAGLFADDEPLVEAELFEKESTPSYTEPLMVIEEVEKEVEEPIERKIDDLPVSNLEPLAVPEDVPVEPFAMDMVVEEPQLDEELKMGEENGLIIHTEPTILSDYDAVIEETPLEEPIYPVPTPSITELSPSEQLEPKNEIIEEAPIYNELSEWTLAHEGFTTRNGDFVPLAPPRALMKNHSSASGRLQKSGSPKEVADNGDGLFGSVRNIFKKK